MEGVGVKSESRNHSSVYTECLLKGKSNLVLLQTYLQQQLSKQICTRELGFSRVKHFRYFPDKNAFAMVKIFNLIIGKYSSMFENPTGWFQSKDSFFNLAWAPYKKCLITTMLFSRNNENDKQCKMFPCDCEKTTRVKYLWLLPKLLRDWRRKATERSIWFEPHQVALRDVS